MASLPDTLTFITSHADEADLARVVDAVKMRRDALGQVRSASLRVGSPVRIVEVSPKYLIGLTGTVTAIQKQRATVTLDETSTQTLRFKGGSRFFVAGTQTAYPLTGVPLSSCELSVGVGA